MVMNWKNLPNNVRATWADIVHENSWKVVTNLDFI